MREEDVVGLDFAVYDALAVNVVEGIRRLDQHLEQFARLGNEPVSAPSPFARFAMKLAN